MMSLAKPVQGYTCPWWTPEIDETVREVRAIRRREGYNMAIREANRWKKRLINRAKTAYFRESVHEAATRKDGIWRLMRWAKERSHLPFEPPIIP